MYNWQPLLCDNNTITDVIYKPLLISCGIPLYQPAVILFIPSFDSLLATVAIFKP